MRWHQSNPCLAGIELFKNERKGMKWSLEISGYLQTFLNFFIFFFFHRLLRSPQKLKGRRRRKKKFKWDFSSIQHLHLTLEADPARVKALRCEMASDHIKYCLTVDKIWYDSDPLSLSLSLSLTHTHTLSLSLSCTKMSLLAVIPVFYSFGSLFCPSYNDLSSTGWIFSACRFFFIWKN